MVLYNVHSILHIHQDALNYGSLDNVSEFSFENYLQFLKKHIRGQKLHLQQVVNRVAEFENVCTISSKFKETVQKLDKSTNVIKKISHNGFIVSTCKGNNCFLTKFDEVICVTRIFEENGVMMVSY